ncbi:MAG TPA: hypothetical protein VFB00_09055 [Terriglobales bacterium]|nr:hypothetical protein [Terriglobales bacterium]
MKNSMPAADGPSAKPSPEQLKEIEEGYQAAEKKLRAAAEAANSATSNESKLESLREVHRNVLRMIFLGVYLGKSGDEPLELSRKLLAKPSPQPDPSA